MGYLGQKKVFHYLKKPVERMKMCVDEVNDLNKHAAVKFKIFDPNTNKEISKGVDLGGIDLEGDQKQEFDNRKELVDFCKYMLNDKGYPVVRGFEDGINETIRIEKCGNKDLYSIGKMAKVDGGEAEGCQNIYVNFGKDDKIDLRGLNVIGTNEQSINCKDTLMNGKPTLACSLPTVCPKVVCEFAIYDYKVNFGDNPPLVSDIVQVNSLHSEL